MRKSLKSWRMIVAVVAMVVLMGASGAFAQCAPRVDNFFVFVDQSGSMYMTYQPLNTPKMAVAKRLISQLDSTIYELGYNGSMVLFAPFKEVQPLTVYKNGVLSSSLTMIKDEQKIFGRKTPMKTGLLELERKAVLDNVTGPTTVIMLTDGMASWGQDPLKSVKQLADKYPRVTFHVISLAQPGIKGSRNIKTYPVTLQAEKKGADTCQQIASLGRGIYVDSADLLDNRAAMQRFVNQVFCAKEKIILRGVQFDFDRSEIKPEYEPILDEAVNQLKKWVLDYQLVINGHTDSIGGSEYNQRLSEKRAMAIRDYFAAKGISPNKVRTVGYGENVPIATNATNDGRALNRRVELDLLQ